MKVGVMSFQSPEVPQGQDTQKHGTAEAGDAQNSFQSLFGTKHPLCDHAVHSEDTKGEF